MSWRTDPPFELKVAIAAGRDLEAIRQSDPDAHDRITAVLDELRADQQLLQNLLEDRYGQRPGERYTATFGVQFIGKFARDTPRREVWRFKIWDLENHGVRYRIVYMFLPRRRPETRLFIILAIAPRAWNYEYADPLYDRITADYDRFKAKYG